MGDRRFWILDFGFWIKRKLLTSYSHLPGDPIATRVDAATRDVLGGSQNDSR